MGVENFRVGFGIQQSRRVSVFVALNLSSLRIRSFLRVTHSAKRRAVQERTVVQVKNKDRCIRSDRIDLLQSGHPALGELKFSPATYYSDPLWRCGALRLIF